MLIVMKYRNIQKLLQTFLNLKAAGSAYVFQIDAAEAGCQISYGFDDLLSVLGIQTDGNCIDIAEFLEEDCLAFHNGHCRIGTDITETENRTSVGDDSNGVGFHGIFVSGFFVLCNYFAGFRNTGSISDRKIFTGLDGSLGDGFQFAVPFFVHQ